jgi:hypothetical protein
VPWSKSFTFADPYPYQAALRISDVENPSDSKREILHLVRRAFLRADPSTTTVTRLATDQGFWELGRFSVAYRALFGELPSQTLRRPANARPVLLNRPSSLEGSAYQ